MAGEAEDEDAEEDLRVWLRCDVSERLCANGGKKVCGVKSAVLVGVVLSGD